MDYSWPPRTWENQCTYWAEKEPRRPSSFLFSWRGISKYEARQQCRYTALVFHSCHAYLLGGCFCHRSLSREYALCLVLRSDDDDSLYIFPIRAHLDAYSSWTLDRADKMVQEENGRTRHPSPHGRGFRAPSQYLCCVQLGRQTLRDVFS